MSLVHEVVEGLATSGWLDQLNLVLGITGVVLMIRRSLWAFPVGMVAVTVQGVLFWQWTFYADAKLQAFFFICLGYGWWHWVKHKGNAPELPVTRTPRRALSGWLVVAVLGTVGWGWWQANHTDAAMPYRDTFIASFSMVAQILQVRKRLENWIGWMLVNAVAVATYAAAGLTYTAFLYAVFFGMALIGWGSWRRAMNANGEENDA